MTGFQPVIVDGEVRSFINFKRMTMLAYESDGHGYYQVVAYDKIPRDSTEQAKVILGRYKSRNEAEQAVHKLYNQINFNND